ncbi:protein NUCLEAR FUSION DEFECTIVE 2-like [Mangifera indica]|uniref:protein NUCLEAR FUSION DEFECTIVE 2-like n=1 Tax=Mangifera indica TaxID=29780 RepID=UPI001CFB2CF3|nr:protein NUCLEAR FUSION DEFECTIVE 2-like [Mangifera indica]
MSRRRFTLFTAIFLFAFSVPFLAGAAKEPHDQRLKYLSSPFEAALEMLQKQIGYNFKRIEVLRRAMTHPSFSEENNRALSILGANVIETSVSLHILRKDIEISPKDLNRRISEISNVESSCAIDGLRLGIHKVIRVSPRTNSSIPAVVCGAYRAIFGAIAIDTNKSDDAGNVFWIVHGGDIGRALAF